MVTHSSNLAWKIPWTEESGGLQSMGSQRVGDTPKHTQPILGLEMWENSYKRPEKPRCSWRRAESLLFLYMRPIHGQHEIKMKTRWL